MNSTRKDIYSNLSGFGLWLSAIPISIHIRIRIRIPFED